MSTIPIAEAPLFSINEYLRERKSRDGFVVVEIGHGGEPICADVPEFPNRSDFFVGKNYYYGVEANLRDPVYSKRKRISEIKERTKDKNINFISISAGGQAIRFGEEISKYYAGDYRTHSGLEDGVADEVVFGNVFGDPHIAYNRARTMALLMEGSRLLANSGLIVVRETITPYSLANFNEANIAMAGLNLMTAYSPGNKDQWGALEGIYSTSDRKIIHPDSMYFLLNKPELDD